jgi:hypothetical protein
MTHPVLKRLRRRRCGARTRRNIIARDRAVQEGRLAKFLRHSGYCKNWALPGSARCRLHGGLSTGPRTPQGKARTVAALKAGRIRWLAKLKSEGKPAPCGRKRGGRNRPIEEREHAAHAQKCRRDFRTVLRSTRADRKARRVGRRQEQEEARLKAADHARRKARAEAGLGYWTEEEWEAL